MLPNNFPTDFHLFTVYAGGDVCVSCLHLCVFLRRLVSVSGSSSLNLFSLCDVFCIWKDRPWHQCGGRNSGWDWCRILILMSFFAPRHPPLPSWETCHRSSAWQFQQCCTSQTQSSLQDTAVSMLAFISPNKHVTLSRDISAFISEPIFIKCIVSVRWIFNEVLKYSC